VSELETKLDQVHAAFLEQRNLAEETKGSLVSEQLELQSKTMEGDMLRREGVSQEQELRNLREAWNERESRISRLEEQRLRIPFSDHLRRLRPPCVVLSCTPWTKIVSFEIPPSIDHHNPSPSSLFDHPIHDSYSSHP